MTAILSNPERALQLLCAQEQTPTPLHPHVAIDMALKILDVFGQRYTNAIPRRLHTSIKKEYGQAYAALVEIQKRLLRGEENYVSRSCPKTKSVLSTYPEQTNLQTVFQFAKIISCALLPFPQQILKYKNPDVVLLRKLEKDREGGFFKLVEVLNRKIREVEEIKGVPSSPEPNYRNLSAEQELALTKVYFRGGALVYNGKVVYFNEMVRMWVACSHRNIAKLDRFLQLLTLREWVSDDPRPVMKFLYIDEHIAEGMSFKDFLVHSSIIALQRNFQLDFSLGIKAVLKKKFSFSETDRCDLCYISADFQFFYYTDFRCYNRTQLLRSFQLYFFFLKNFQLPPSPLLLNILIFMSDNWMESEIPSFLKRKELDERTSVIDAAERASFHATWSGFQQILNVSAKRSLSPSCLTEEDETLINTPQSWKLFMFLWQQSDGKRDLLLRTICTLGELPQFGNMTLSSVYEFCKKNCENLIEEITQDFLQSYRDVIDLFNLPNPQYLFFDPSHEIRSTPSTTYGNAFRRASDFKMHMSPYTFTKVKEYWFMLRHWILYPNLLKFELLKDCQAIGAAPSEELLYDVFSKDFEPFQEGLRSDQRSSAIGLTRSIQNSYHLSDVQIFSIYLEIVRIVQSDQSAVVRKMSQAVLDLVRFCPALTNDTIYYLFRFHPNISRDLFLGLVKMRDDWAKNDLQLNRFVIDQELYRRVVIAVDEFLTPLAEASPDLGHEFFTHCQRSLLSAFFMQLQPLSNFFHITGVTVEGIRWGQTIWKTHEGQLKFILKHANVGVYFNWSVWKDRPIFFLSFFNISTGTAFSSFIPMMVSSESISSEEIRKPFWGLLSTLAQQVLREESDFDVSESASDEPETWMSAYSGVRKTIQDYSEMIPQWQFLQGVKLNYRWNFLRMVANRPLGDFVSWAPLDIAALGHIFPAHERGSLLPEAVFNLETEQSYFIPDASIQFVEECRRIFAISTPRYSSLNLYLCVPQTGNAPLRIFYHSQTAEEFIGQAVNKNERAASVDETAGRYISLSIEGIRIPLRYPLDALQNRRIFQKYFDYHNLLLKAAYYFTSSLE